MRSEAVSHARESAKALEFNVFGSPGAVKIKPGTRSVAAGCSAGGLVTVGKQRCHRGGLVRHAGRGEHGGRAAETVADDAELGRVDADLAGPEANTGHDVEGGTEIEGQVEHRRRQAPFGVGGAGHDAPRRQMFEQARIAGGLGEPVVTERDPGQIQPRLRGVHHPRHTGEGQVTTQNPMRATAAEGCDELAGAGHASTLAHRG